MLMPALPEHDRYHLLRDQRGGTAVEFALILPLMILIYLGGFDLARKIEASSKLGDGARTLADLTSQEPTGQDQPSSDITSFIAATGAVLSPFTAGAKITVSAIDLKLNNTVCCTATVRWSVTQGGALRPCNTQLRQIGRSDLWAVDTIPASIATQSTVLVSGVPNFAGSVIVTDVGYTYASMSPAIGGLMSGAMMEHAYGLPRTSGQVTLAAPLSLASGQTGQICS